MQNKANSPDFATANPFSEHFQKFGNTRLFDRLQNKFTPKPYYYQYRTLRLVVLGASFLFHILSAATAAALIYLFTAGLIPSAIFAAVVTFAALIILEISKRETSGRLFHDWLQFSKFSPGLFAVVLTLAAVSTSCSYFGAERAVKTLTPPPTLESVDTLTAPIRTQLATIDGQISDAKRNTWRGKVTSKAQRTIERLTRQKESLINEMIRQQNRVDGRNDATEQEHHYTTESNAAGFALFTAGCEVLMLLCLWFLQYYDFRSYAEYCSKPVGKSGEKSGFPITQEAGTNSTPAEFLTKQNSNGNRLPTNETTPYRPIGFRTTKIVNENRSGSNLRTCTHCQTQYTYMHHKQKYCTEQCRIAAWENRTGKTLRKKGISADPLPA